VLRGLRLAAGLTVDHVSRQIFQSADVILPYRARVALANCRRNCGNWPFSIISNRGSFFDRAFSRATV